MNRQVVLRSRPVGMPNLENFALKEGPEPDMLQGGLVIKPKFLSVDPYMRARMRPSGSNLPAFEIDKPLEGTGIAEIIESQNKEFQVGDLVKGVFLWQEIQIIQADKVTILNKNIDSPSEYLGVLGLTGLTAYFGLLDVGKPTAGETVVISGAAGAVGGVAGQMAKIKGCRVVGIAGSDDKVRILKEELHFDEAVNYKNEDWDKFLKNACPNGVDIYFDNVGGEISDAVLSNLNQKARVIICGQISLYNDSTTSTGPRVQPLLLDKKALMQGFSVRNYSDQFDTATEDLSGWMKEGKIISQQTILRGFENLPVALVGLFQGINKGKCLVEI